MTQTVYVDLFFLVNFSMDFLCLFLTAKILSLRLSVLRSLAGAAMGGLYADLSLFLPLGQVLSLLLHLLVCALMCAVTFLERRRARSLPLYILVFVAISMALGGVMTALFNLFNHVSLFEGIEEVEGDGISVWVFGVLALISGGITLLGGRFFAGRSAQKYARVELRYGGRSLRLDAMTDSGNLLRDPISGKACIVADMRVMERLLPGEIIRAARQGAAGAMESVGREHVKNLRLIPTRTASGSGLLLGVRMERVTVYTEKESHSVDAYVALAELGNSAGGKEALLPPTLLIGS